MPRKGDSLLAALPKAAGFIGNLAEVGWHRMLQLQAESGRAARA
ncbi:MAG: hypothetical protein WBB85_09175 [Albidovulum sp.]